MAQHFLQPEVLEELIRRQQKSYCMDISGRYQIDVAQKLYRAIKYLQSGNISRGQQQIVHVLALMLEGSGHLAKEIAIEVLVQDDTSDMLRQASRICKESVLSKTAENLIKEPEGE